MSWKLSGWDFTALGDRWTESVPPWDYSEKVGKLFRADSIILDLGTGGGEVLSSLVSQYPLGRSVIATEGYPPNAPVARDRLRTYGIEVVETYSDDNMRVPQRGRLPFRESSFDIVIDRHESFVASEVFQVLKDGGIFATQQVGSENNVELNQILDAPLPEQDEWGIQDAKVQLEEAGFEITEALHARLRTHFKDIGAVVCYLRSMPWQFPDFSIEKYLPRLRALHERMSRDGLGLDVTATRFYIQCFKGGGGGGR